MAITERLDQFQRRHRWAGFPLAVVYKYFDDFGAYLAALLTYYGFVSLFPLLLLLSTILGFVLSGDQRLQHEVLTSALHQFPVIGGDLDQPKRLGGARSASSWVSSAPCTAAWGWRRPFSTRPTRCGQCRATAAEPLQGPRPQPAAAGHRRIGPPRHDHIVHPERRRGRGARRSGKVADPGGVRSDQHRRVRLRVPLCAGAAAVRARRGAGRDNRSGDLAAAAIVRDYLRPARGPARTPRTRCSPLCSACLRSSTSRRRPSCSARRSTSCASVTCTPDHCSPHSPTTSP